MEIQSRQVRLYTASVLQFLVLGDLEKVCVNGWPLMKEERLLDAEWRHLERRCICVSFVEDVVMRCLHSL